MDSASLNHAMIDDQERKRPRPPPMPMANRGTKASSQCSSNRDTTATPTTTKTHGASFTPSRWHTSPNGLLRCIWMARSDWPQTRRHPQH